MSVLPVGFGSSDTGGIDTGDIEHSLRFRGAQYLSRTPVGSVSHTKYTFSHWVKRAKFGAYQNLINATNSGNNRVFITFGPDDRLAVYAIVSSALAAYKITTRVFRDPTAWLYIHVVYDTTLTIAEDRLQVWIGGVRETSFSTNTNPAQNAVIWIDDPAWILRIGNDVTSGYYPEGGMARFIGVSGSAFSPSDFIEFNPTINEWVSKTQAEVKAVVDAGGTNSFMLDFDNGTSLTTLGYDKSSKGNNWTLNNFSLTAGVDYDWMLDVPGNSYATLNPLYPTAVAPTNANIRLAYAAAAWYASKVVEVSTGKHYVEVVWDTVAANAYANLGIMLPSQSVAAITYAGVTTTSWGLWVTSNIAYCYNNAAPIQTRAGTYNAASTGMLALDMDAGKGWVGIDGVWLGGGDPAAGTTPTFTFTANTPYCIAVGANNNAGVHLVSGAAPLQTAATFQSAAGGYFTRTVPTGFLALCQANLDATGTVIVSGTFTGNASAGGPCVWMNGVPKTLTINGTAVTFGTHADKLATGFKVRTASASYNTAGSNTWTATIDSDLQSIFKYNNAEGNP